MPVYIKNRRRRYSDDKLYRAYFNFSGGQNDTSLPDNLKDTECELIENFDIITRGGLISRPGTVSVPVFGSTVANRIDRIVEHEKSDGTIKRLILTGGSLYDWDSPSTALLTGLGNHLDYARFGDKTYILANGSMYQYDGSTVTAVTNNQTDSKLDVVKKCRYIEKRGDRMFCTGNPDDPSALYFSQPLDPTYYKDGQYIIQAMSDDGDVNTGLKEYHGALLVFKIRSVYAWFGYNLATDVEFKKLNVHTGTKAYRTVVNVGNYLFYLGEDGVYALLGLDEGIISTKKISINQKNEFSKVVHRSPYYDNTPWAVFDNGKYMLWYCTNSNTPAVNDRVAVFHYDAWHPVEENNEPWSFYSGLKGGDGLKSLDGTLYIGSSENNTFFKFDDTALDDLGSPIMFKVRFKAYDQGAPIHLKKYKYSWIVVRQYEQESTNLTVKTTIDYKNIEYSISGDASMVYGEGVWGGAYWGWSDTVTIPINLGGEQGLKVQHTLEGYSLNNKICIYGIAFQFKLKKPERGGA